MKISDVAASRWSAREPSRRPTSPARASSRRREPVPIRRQVIDGPAGRGRALDLARSANASTSSARSAGAAGVAVEVGAGVSGISPGDRVAIAGAGAANHAEIDVVPRPALRRSPTASPSTTPASRRSARSRCTASVAPICRSGRGSRWSGLGLVGQLAAQVALAAGCRVLGVDLQAAARPRRRRRRRGRAAR